MTDGTTHTIYVGEKYGDYKDDLGWMSGTRATLRNTGTALNMILTSVRAKSPPAAAPARVPSQ